MKPLVALAGGVGGAKLAEGLAQIAGERLSVIVNTADDFEHLGLSISPDLDTVMYTLAGLANPETGWGVRGETWQCLRQIGRLGGETWFKLGDRDLAVHVLRSERLRRGESLTAVTRALCSALGIPAQVLPMTDQRVSTIVHTVEGPLPFQEYFVGNAMQCDGDGVLLRWRRDGHCHRRRRERTVESRSLRHRRRAIESLRQHRSDPRGAEDARLDHARARSGDRSLAYHRRTGSEGTSGADDARARA
jgi:2-phospho-L-lactate transferase